MTRTAGRFVHLAVVFIVAVPLGGPFAGFLLMQIILIVNAARGRSYPFSKAGFTTLHKPELLLLLPVVVLRRSIVGGIVHVSVIRLMVVVVIIIIVISGYHRNFFVVVAGVGF